MRILLVEDEARVAGFIAKGLREQTYAVDVAANGEDALYQAGVNQYDLVVMDVLLPIKDGCTVCRELRASGFRAPILMLTARDAVDDRVAGLDAGADDYLARAGKPVSLTAKEYALLEFLMLNEGRVVGREQIAQHVWDESFDPFSNVIDVYIRRLRAKLDAGAACPLIHTRRGAGYVLGDAR